MTHVEKQYKITLNINDAYAEMQRDYIPKLDIQDYEKEFNNELFLTVHYMKSMTLIFFKTELARYVRTNDWRDHELFKEMVAIEKQQKQVDTVRMFINDDVYLSAVKQMDVQLHGSLDDSPFLSLTLKRKTT